MINIETALRRGGNWKNYEPYKLRLWHGNFLGGAGGKSPTLGGVRGGKHPPRKEGNARLNSTIKINLNLIYT